MNKNNVNREEIFSEIKRKIDSKKGQEKVKVISIVRRCRKWKNNFC